MKQSPENMAALFDAVKKIRTDAVHHIVCDRVPSAVAYAKGLRFLEFAMSEFALAEAMLQTPDNPATQPTLNGIE